jgi:hypothetical protein
VLLAATVSGDATRGCRFGGVPSTGRAAHAMSVTEAGDIGQPIDVLHTTYSRHRRHELDQAIFEGLRSR